jgi:hypothetical protein
LARKKYSSPGPDWTDVATLLSAIESLHGVSVFLGMSCDGAPGEGSLLVTLTAMQTAGGRISWSGGAGVAQLWMVGSGVELPAMCLGLGYELDKALGEELWGQTELPI